MANIKKEEFDQYGQTLNPKYRHKEEIINVPNLKLNEYGEIISSLKKTSNNRRGRINSREMYRASKEKSRRTERIKL